jgi:coenzyme F420-reducing hydrogenase delta subunit
VLIGCQHSAGEAVAELAAQGRPLPDGVEWVSVPCGGSVDELTILRAFEAGAQEVLVIACCEGACRSLAGNRWAEKRVGAVRALLAEVGIAPERLVFRNLAPSQAADLVVSLQPSAVSSEVASGQVSP